MQLIRNLLTQDRSVCLTQPGRTTALLILPGFGTMKADWSTLAQGFAATGDYDVYLPDYFARESVGACAAKLETFVAANQLHRYERIVAFAYILGGWVFNRYLQANPLPNLHAVVYDRSPIQDLAPVAITQAFPLLTRLVAGRVVADLAQTPYPPQPQADVNVGLIIENGVTASMRPFRRMVLRTRSLTWNPDQFRQPHTDYCYVPLNHDEMYDQFDAFVPQVAHFYAHGRFGDAARRDPYTQDPFSERPG